MELLRKSHEDSVTLLVKQYDEKYIQLILAKDTQERSFHEEMKQLTAQLLDVMKEKSVSETKVTEVLQQVVDVQQDVERTLDKFIDKFEGGGSRDRRR